MPASVGPASVPPPASGMTPPSYGAPLHRVSGGGHVSPHLPFEQTSPVMHALPQLWQFALSVEGSTHLPLHSICGAEHIEEPSVAASELMPPSDGGGVVASPPVAQPPAVATTAMSEANTMASSDRVSIPSPSATPRGSPPAVPKL